MLLFRLRGKTERQTCSLLTLIKQHLQAAMTYYSSDHSSGFKAEYPENF